MRKLILLLGLVLQVIIVNAQSVSGSLVDEKGNPVSFANVVLLSLNPQLHSRSATYIKRNGLLIRKITIKSSRPFQCAYHPLTP